MVKCIGIVKCSNVFKNSNETTFNLVGNRRSPFPVFVCFETVFLKK